MRVLGPARSMRVLGPARSIAVAVLIVVGLGACGSGTSKVGRKPASPRDVPKEAPMPITLTSARFADGATIPTRSTCDGQNVSPPLAWTGVPSGAAQLALTMEDPDAPGGTFVHWVMWGIPTTDHELDEGVVPAGVHEGANGAGSRGYTGPCPPKGGGAHRYVFMLAALSRPVSLADGATIAELRAAMDGSVLATGRLVGRYGR